jgi:heme oxygenase
MSFARALPRSAASSKTSESLREQLRRGSAAAHADLEASLDLVRRVSDRQLFVRVLERFLGFHLAWEHAIRRDPAFADHHAARSRLPHLRRDLAVLGRTHAEQARLPVCADAAGLAAGHAEAVGSLYVMEGSTLGGQVIGRALQDAAWAPRGGLTYFQPYGPRTGEMWRSFLDWADASVPAGERDRAVAGAQRTFDVLRGWLAS